MCMCVRMDATACKRIRHNGMRGGVCVLACICGTDGQDAVAGTDSQDDVAGTVLVLFSRRTATHFRESMRLT